VTHPEKEYALLQARSAFMILDGESGDPITTGNDHARAQEQLDETGLFRSTS